MTEDQQAAVRTCAEWVEWIINGVYVRDAQRPWIPTSPDLQCLLWEDCRAKLCAMYRNERRLMELHCDATIWWCANSEACAWCSPLQNLEELAEVLS